eukprot:TRINITY_DN71338_c0_g1_i1.p1 TRINITY_DN71338_c0_g1~~TRINITY_DN71338_c0_g1_i1.p1  ORF type:complete len:317 (+),score=112.78 TRINITY_DN71338_c0_g1_i1:103-951(+)
MVGSLSPLARKPGRKLERPIRAAVHNLSTDLQADSKRYGRVRDDLATIWLQPRRPGEAALRDIAFAATRSQSPPLVFPGGDPLEQARLLSSYKGPRKGIGGRSCDETCEWVQKRKQALQQMQVRNYWDSREGKIGASETQELSPRAPAVARTQPQPDSGSPALGFPRIRSAQSKPAAPHSSFDHAIEKIRQRGEVAGSAAPSAGAARSHTHPTPSSAAWSAAARRSPLRAVSERQVGNCVYKSLEASSFGPYIPIEHPRPSDEYFKLDRALRKLHPFEHRRR